MDVAGQTERSLFVVGSDVVFLLVAPYILFQSTNGYEALKGLSYVLFAALHQFHMQNSSILEVSIGKAQQKNRISSCNHI